LAREVANVARFPVSAGETERLASARRVAPEVYELYLQGGFLTDQMTDEGFRRGQANFEKAIELDPTFAPAYASLADAYAIQGYLYADPTAALAKSEEVARKAMALDPESGEAHAALAYIDHFFRWDWKEAEAEYQRAIDLNPNYAPARRRYWGLLELLGRHEEAGRQIRRALEIDPLSPNTNANLAMHSVMGRDYAEALRQLDSGLRLWPQDGPSLLYRWQTLELMGRPQAERRAALRAAVHGMSYDGALPAIEAAAGLDDPAFFGACADALAHLAASQRVLPTIIAELYLMAGNDAEALAWLERGLASHSPDMAFFPIHPRWQEALARPEFKGVIAALHLPRRPAS
jgi:tetratricopeptide (TPR) repeat protein